MLCIRRPLDLRFFPLLTIALIVWGAVCVPSGVSHAETIKITADEFGPKTYRSKWLNNRIEIDEFSVENHQHKTFTLEITNGFDIEVEDCSGKKSIDRAICSISNQIKSAALLVTKVNHVEIHLNGQKQISLRDLRTS